MKKRSVNDQKPGFVLRREEREGAMQTRPGVAAPPRYALIDALRGFAIVLMIAYHFSFDLNYHGWIHQDFNHSTFWLTARACIVSLFLTLSGISLVLNAQRANASSFWRRQLKLLAACVAVTVGSYLMFPQSFIFFGILHFILLASLLGRFCVRFYYANLAAALLVLGINYSNPLFNAPWLQWVGFMTYKPFTEDYVPLFPWFGVVLTGIFIGKLIVAHPTRLNSDQTSRLLKPLTLAGRHSLAIYLLHQPVLLAVLTLVTFF